MYSVCFKKDFAKRFHPSSFDIRYSAVRCFIQAIEAASLIIKIQCQFGVVSYERFRGSRLHSRLWSASGMLIYEGSVSFVRSNPKFGA